MTVLTRVNTYRTRTCAVLEWRGVVRHEAQSIKFPVCMPAISAEIGDRCAAYMPLSVVAMRSRTHNILCCCIRLPPPCVHAIALPVCGVPGTTLLPGSAWYCTRYLASSYFANRRGCPVDFQIETEPSHFGHNSRCHIMDCRRRWGDSEEGNVG